MNGAATTALSYPDVTLAALPASMARLYGDRVAVVDGDREFSYTELDRRSAAMASALHADGVVERDVVLIHLTNSIEFVVAYYGALRAGATVTLINPLQPVEGLRNQIVEASAVVAFTHSEQVSRLLDARRGTSLRTVVVADSETPTENTETLASYVEGHADAPAVTITSDSIAHLAFTGGTTGVSKGVRVLHRNVLANITQMIGWRAGHDVLAEGGLVHLAPRDGSTGRGVVPGAAVTIVVSPLFHAHALINLSFLLMCGATHFLAGRFDPARMLELIEACRATYITGSPAMWQAVARHPDATVRDTSSVRVVSSGAAPIDQVTLEALASAFPSSAVVEGYGLTEATCLVASTPLSTCGGEYKRGSVGPPTFDTEVEIRDVGDRTTVLGPGEPGGLWVRGPQVTDGYHRDPQATAAQYVDGWLDTGDIAYRDEDDYLFICDRAKDMLIYKGYNVYPRELEEILMAHPDVSEAAVVGRAARSAGEEPVAVVVPVAGHVIDAAALTAFVAERVLPYKKIRDVIVADSLPTSAAGKIQKVQLREWLAARTNT